MMNTDTATARSDRLLAAALIEDEQLYLTGADLERLRLGFHGVEAHHRGQQTLNVVFEDGMAALSDGARLHAIPVNYKMIAPVEVPLGELQALWMHQGRQGADAMVRSRSAEGMFRWTDMIPKVDIGVLCDIDRWLPAVESIASRSWVQLTFSRRTMKLVTIGDGAESLQLELPHLMYKGKQHVAASVRRLCRPKHLYDAFHNAAALGDTRLFVCSVAGNVAAPLFCRGNLSSLLVLMLSKK